MIEPLLGLYWTSYWASTGPLLELYLISIGPLLDLCWTFTRPLLDVYWAGALLDIYWASTAPLLDSSVAPSYLYTIRQLLWPLFEKDWGEFKL